MSFYAYDNKKCSFSVIKPWEIIWFKIHFLNQQCPLYSGLIRQCPAIVDSLGGLLRWLGLKSGCWRTKMKVWKEIWKSGWPRVLSRFLKRKANTSYPASVDLVHAYYLFTVFGVHKKKERLIMMIFFLGERKYEI